MTWDVLIPATIYALPLYVGLFLTWRRTKTVAEKVDQGVQKISLEVDGRLTQLLELTRRASRAEGVAEEKADAAYKAAAETHTTLSDVKPALMAVAAAVPAIAVLAEVTPKIIEKLNGPNPPEPPGEFTGLVNR
jgi:hypothetical protein